MRTGLWVLGASTRHGIGVFAARALPPATCVGAVLFAAVGALGVLAAIGGFPLWYLNYDADPSVRLDARGRVWTTRAVAAREELTMRDAAAHV